MRRDAGRRQARLTLACFVLRLRFSFAVADRPVHVCRTGDFCCYLHKGGTLANDSSFESGAVLLPPSPPTPRPTPTPPPTMPGSDQVSTGSYNVTGLRCQTSTVDIYFPSDLSRGPFPIVSFAHVAA